MDYFIHTTTDHLSSTGGIALVGKIVEKIGFGVGKLYHLKDGWILKSLLGLLTQARTHYEEIDLFRQDNFFKEALNLKIVPAKETLRLYLERLAKNPTVISAIIRSNLTLLSKTVLTPITVNNQEYLPVDIDTSPMDNSKSHKEGVSRTYKQFDGYHPIFSYIGEEGYMLACQLREGKQHCQKDTPEYLEKTIDLVNKLTKSKKHQQILFRLDGGNDSKDTLKVLHESGHFYLVKRNLRKELPEYWLSVAEAQGEVTYRDERKIVYTGFHTGKTPANDEIFEDIEVVYEVTQRFVDRDGTNLLFPQIQVETFWTNLYEDPQTVIQLYHSHGTSEQFHSELKSDMNVERLPSGKFAVNALVLQVSMIAFNILRFIGQRAIETAELLPYQVEVKRKRLRKVIDDLIRISVKIVKHARRSMLKLSEHDPWYPCFQKLYGICQAM